jgi:hypothetical protein
MSAQGQVRRHQTGNSIIGCPEHWTLATVGGCIPCHPTEVGPNQQKLICVHHNREEIPTVLGDEVVREVFA